LKVLKYQVLTILLILTLFVPVTARTRADSVGLFLNQVRVSENGFAETPNGLENILSTTKALQVSNILNLEINQSSNIIHYYQKAQNSDFGFGIVENEESSLLNTVLAIEGLLILGVNSSQLINWKIFEYLNSTITKIVYTDVNGTAVINPLTLETMEAWYQLVWGSILLGSAVTIPAMDLIPKLKAIQYPNGSYFSFEYAQRSMMLLGLLGAEPNDPALAKEYLLAHHIPDSGFASRINGNPTLNATYAALSSLVVVSNLFNLGFIDDLTRLILDLPVASSGFTDFSGNEITVSSTWYAVQILLLLGKIVELYSPDVLQEFGFVNLNIFIFTGAILLLSKMRRLK
jgi:hypothetical protein